MLRTSNYLNLSSDEKLERVLSLQLMRASTMRQKRVKMASPSRKPRRRKPTFLNPELEKLFYSMSQEQQDYIMKGEQ